MVGDMRVFFISKTTKKPIAYGYTEIKRREVKLSHKRTAESINANRQWNLVDAQTVKMSTANRWGHRVWDLPLAVEIYDGEWWIDLTREI